MFDRSEDESSRKQGFLGENVDDRGEDESSRKHGFLGRNVDGRYSGLRAP